MRGNYFDYQPHFEQAYKDILSNLISSAPRNALRMAIADSVKGVLGNKLKNIKVTTEKNEKGFWVCWARVWHCDSGFLINIVADHDSPTEQHARDMAYLMYKARLEQLIFNFKLIRIDEELAKIKRQEELEMANRFHRKRKQEQRWREIQERELELKREELLQEAKRKDAKLRDPLNLEGNW